MLELTNYADNKNSNSFLILNSVRSERFHSVVSRCSNVGGIVKEIKHILVSTHWKILHNCRIFQSEKLFTTNSRLIITATLKLHAR